MPTEPTTAEVREQFVEWECHSIAWKANRCCCIKMLCARLDAQAERIAELESRLNRIAAAADADEVDLEVPRDGTKLTRHVLVQSLVCWKEETDLARGERAEAIGRAERAEASLRLLADAAELFAEDQSRATDKRVGLVQPVTVEECEDLNEALSLARSLLDDRS